MTAETVAWPPGRPGSRPRPHPPAPRGRHDGSADPSGRGRPRSPERRGRADRRHGLRRLDARTADRARCRPPSGSPATGCATAASTSPPLCSPTRQALHDRAQPPLGGHGRHHARCRRPSPATTATGPRSAATIAQILSGNGYCTAALGKWHQTPPWRSARRVRSTAGRWARASTTSTASWAPR